MDGLEDLSRRSAVTQNQPDPTRARPEPWFVGNGRGLMIAIVAVLIALFAARAVSTLVMAERAWEWWQHRVTSAPVLPPDTNVPAARVPPPEIVPSRPIAQAAVAVGPEVNWITADDYPLESLRREEQGRTTMRWRIDTDGRVRQCGAAVSSGYSRLDNAGCDAIIKRARFRPALDAEGRPIATTKTRRVVWRIPE